MQNDRCARCRLFDHLVGKREHPVGHLEAERLGGLEIEHELEFGGLHDRQVGGLLALEDPTGIDTGLIGVRDARSVADQPADRDEFAQRINRWKSAMRGQRAISQPAI
jgi:hypothetical protein